MRLMNTIIYVLAGLLISMIAVAGIAYLATTTTRSAHPSDPTSSEPNSSGREEARSNDSSQDHPALPRITAEPDGCSSDRIYQEGMALVEKDRFYEAFAKIREAFEQDPTNPRYRASLVILQRLSSAEFALRQAEAQGKDSEAPALPLETLLSEAQQARRRVSGIEIEAAPVPDCFLAAQKRLLNRAADVLTAIARDVQEEPLKQEFGKAWRQLDWSGLATHLARAESQTSSKRSGELHELIQTTRGVLVRYESYASAKSDRNLTGMALQLTEMLNILSDPNHLHNQGAADHGVLEEACQWIAKERAALLPQLKPRIEALCDEAVGLFEEYAESPITHDEINRWSAATDFGAVMERATRLSTARSKLAEAETLTTTMLNADPECPVSLRIVESEITRVCAAAHRRAFILEKSYEDSNTAARIHTMVAALPSFENNDLPKQAHAWLQEHDALEQAKSKVH